MVFPMTVIIFGLAALAISASFGGINPVATLADVLWMTTIICFVAAMLAHTIIWEIRRRK